MKTWKGVFAVAAIIIALAWWSPLIAVGLAVTYIIVGVNN